MDYDGRGLIAQRETAVRIILTHENADFDALAALLAAHKLDPEAIPVQPEQLNRNVAAFLALYVSGLPFARRADIDFENVEAITLVDTQRLPQIKGLPQHVPVYVIDHHPVKSKPDPRYTLTGEVIGSTTTLLVEQMQARGIQVSSLEATLLALGIYEDTGSLTYGGTTARDLRAAAWTVEHHAVLDTVRRFLEPPLNEEQQRLFEALLTQSETRVIDGYPIIVAAARIDEYVNEVAGVAHRLREMLDPTGLFVLVEMPGALHLVCRATDDAINVGEVARHFGGGGHERAAAASIHDMTFEETLDKLWDIIARSIQPAVHVRDLMSYGVQTLEADKTLAQVIRKMRRIGHEGFPVVQDGRVVGLLTRRDADRAMEHGLGNVKVHEVMTAGEVTLRPDDSVGVLEQTMVDSGWGQIPVVDDSNRLIGVVTRTDLIKHWASQHPGRRAPGENALTMAEIGDVLGKPVENLIQTIARHAQTNDVAIYLVGGVVRDLLLERPNFDVDFVVEGDAIALARSLSEQYGGTVSSFRPFGTAKWTLTDDVAAALGVEPGTLPDHVDFATARNEFYEHPTALPTVYRGSIKLDLARRDFTINTLAVQLSPEAASGRVLDFFGGVRDLREKRIAVLHNLSFVDDPTRMIRAVRFEHRLGFTIEPRTLELMQTALPMLRRITGERVRNELDLLLQEHEPERGFLRLQKLGLLEAIHPAFRVDERMAERFQMARKQKPPWDGVQLSTSALYWHLLAIGIPVEQLPALNERLLMPKTLAESMLAAARLAQNSDLLRSPDARPSQIDALLRHASDTALYVAWLVCDETLVRERLARYVTEWRSQRPAIDGNALKARGLRPGPCYGRILERLRAARLDGEVTDLPGEEALLNRMLAEGICDDGA